MGNSGLSGQKHGQKQQQCVQADVKGFDSKT